MVSVSCSTKLHAFALSEQLNRHGLLSDLYTTYAYRKNTFLSRFVKRKDNEEIPINKIRTNTLLAFPIKLIPAYSHRWNQMFDKWVAHQMKRSPGKVFIGWSGMSISSIRAAKKKGMTTIVERGSSHIVYQNMILHEEYKKFGIDFKIHPDVIKTELMEYQEADYISIPSSFVKKSFLEQGIDEKKLIMNPYGVSEKFASNDRPNQFTRDKFIIVYLGTLSIRKGLLYLFQALTHLNIPEENVEVWFIGSVNGELKKTIEQFERPNWKFLGHIDHYKLINYLSQCDVGVQPSLEEGLSMVIPQLMACGVPVIASSNSGGENIITDSVNGFIVPIRDPMKIIDRIEMLYEDRKKLEDMKATAATSIKHGFTWNEYGDRYARFIKALK